ncbi:MAG: substrate-binding domain-containing protein [Clostridiales bacterium]|nr:substrate-binding domain-containing protein [Clostridiales bacterium]
MRRAMLFLLAAAVALLCAGCEPPPSPGPSPAPASAKRTYALVVKDVTNPYMRRMFEGFEEACAALGAEALFRGPEGATAEGQIAAVEELIALGADAIAVAANDRDALSEVLRRAIDAGIMVVSLDSDVNPEDRMLHIQQASPEVIGRVLVQAAREMIGGSGAVAILTTTENASNQAQWVSWMLRELGENPGAYRDMPLIDTLYGRDLYEPSRALVEELLKNHPEVKIIVAPTSVGILAAADAVRESGAPVLVTGLGLPSDMADHIRSGICPWMYLWNPIDVGYVAAYAADALVKGEMTGAVGEVLSAGSFGIMKATLAADGGSEIVVGNPMMFDSTNVAVWEEIF